MYGANDPYIVDYPDVLMTTTLMLVKSVMISFQILYDDDKIEYIQILIEYNVQWRIDYMIDISNKGT